MVATYAYDAYGNLTTESGSATTPLLFPGQYDDQALGAYDLRARSYDPGSAQFLSVDPLLAATESPFGYAGGDPVNSSDPTGLFGWGSITHFVSHAVNVLNEDVLPAVHQVSGVVEAFAEFCAVVTSETVVGGLTCGTVALVAAVVNVTTSAVLYAEGRESGTMLALDAVGTGFAGVGSGLEPAADAADSAAEAARALSESWQSEAEAASWFGKVGPWLRSGSYGVKAAAAEAISEAFSAGARGAAAIGFGLAGASTGLGVVPCE